MVLAACTSTPGGGLGLSGQGAGGQGANGHAGAAVRGSGAPTDLSIAQANFKRGAFGLSEKHFRLAIEHNRNNAEAWLGLAASYDQLRRFDLADRAYGKAQELMGDDARLLNNKGYSQILRGNYKKASALLARAIAKAPDDERILRNIEFLDERRAAAGR